MFRPRQACETRRPGIILLVVVSMLTLFAIIGISFVLYAQSEATAARVYREEQQFPQPDVDAQLLLSYFLEQFIYGPGTTNNYSAMLGHDLMTNMFGHNSSHSYAINRIPYSGIGRVQNNSDTYNINYQDRSGGKSPPKPEIWNGNKFIASNPSYTYPDINNMFLAAVQGDGSVLMPSWYRPWISQSGGDPQKSSLRPPELGPPEDGILDVKNLPQSPGYWDGKQYHYNDSIWMDLGFPVQTSLDGRKYKPLFASLVTDLDNRINLRAHGNLNGNSSSGTDPRSRKHASNQGWGRWEVNISYVLNDQTDADEWKNILIGHRNYNTEPPGRFGPLDDKKYKLGSGPGDTPMGRFYSLVDYNGWTDEKAGGPTQALRLPGQPGVPRTTCFPYYNDPNPNHTNWDAQPRGWGNSTKDVLNDHAAIYNFWSPGEDLTTKADYRATNTKYRAADMEALLRYSDTGSPALTSNLFRLCPNNFAKPKVRNLVTTVSYDWNRPGATPYIWDPKTQNLHWTQQEQYPRGEAIPFPPQLGANPPSGSEFAPTTWHNAYAHYVYDPNHTLTSRNGSGWVGHYTSAFPYLAAPRPNSANPKPGTPEPPRNSGIPRMTSFPYRFDLNMKLPHYPSPTLVVEGGALQATRITDLTSFVVAQEARQLMAAEIFDRLRAVTGAPDPAAAVKGAADGKYDALRWLAQLAVNMVDYIDEDSYFDKVRPPRGNPSVRHFDSVITAFQWNPNHPNDYVYGTELPRLVINEAYAEVNNLASVTGQNPDPNNANQDPTLIQNKGKGKGGNTSKASTFRVNVWVELLNPLRNDNTLDQDFRAHARLQTPGQGPQAAFGGYRILLTKPLQNKQGKSDFNRDNTGGQPANMNLWTPPTPGSNNPGGGRILYRYDTYNDQKEKDPKKKEKKIKIACIVDKFNSQGGAANRVDVQGDDDQTQPPKGSQITPGYYVIGPTTPPATNQLIQHKPAFPTSITRPEMSYDFPATEESILTDPKNPNTTPDGAKPYQPTVVLQRLLCPYLPPNYPGMDTEILWTPEGQPAQPASQYPHADPLNNQVAARYPTDPGYYRPLAFDPKKPYNPYITVDYVENLHLNYNAKFDSKGQVTGKTSPKELHSEGRTEPYAGHPSLWKPTPQTAGGGQIHQTFGHTNGLTKAAFHWLVHMDRELVSPMELLQVSTYMPHELTHQFAIPNPDPGAGKTGPTTLYYQHRAFWDDQAALEASRVYRVFEFLHCHDRSAGAVSANYVGDVIKIQKNEGNEDPPVYQIATTLRGLPGNKWGVPWWLGNPRVGTGGSNPATQDKGVTMITIGNPGTSNITRYNLETVEIVGIGEGGHSIEVRLRQQHQGPSNPLDLSTAQEHVWIWHTAERLPGPINLNTVWDKETFRALCDPNGANNFSLSDVDSIFDQLVQRRTPSGGTTRPTPSSKDRPFRGMAQGQAPQGDSQYPAGTGIEDTWLRSISGKAAATPANPVQRLFDVPFQQPQQGQGQRPRGQPHPYLKHQLLNKIYNTITCRSNVFAVWLTVGFFEVQGDYTALPPKLGQEIGIQEGRNIRHRMFAIVDRSAEATSSISSGRWYGPVDDDSSSELKYTTSGGAITPGSSVQLNADMQYASIGGTFRIYEIQNITPPPTPVFGPGGKIVGYKQGPPKPTVVNDESNIKIVDATPLGRPSSVTAKFSKPHAAGSIIAYGVNDPCEPRHNVGNGQAMFHPDQRPGTVPFYSVIK